MSTGGEVANALVCKTSIRGFNSRPVLHTAMILTSIGDKPRHDSLCLAFLVFAASHFIGTKI